jgi:hypothetical protein
MKIVITHLVKEKEQLAEKLAKNAPPEKNTPAKNAPSTKPIPLASKPPTPSKPIATKTTALSSPILKKPSLTNPIKVIYNPINHSKEVLTIKSPSYIKFN